MPPSRIAPASSAASASSKSGDASTKTGRSKAVPLPGAAARLVSVTAASGSAASLRAAAAAGAKPTTARASSPVQKRAGAPANASKSSTPQASKAPTPSAGSASGARPGLPAPVLSRMAPQPQPATLKDSAETSSRGTAPVASSQLAARKQGAGAAGGARAGPTVAQRALSAMTCGMIVKRKRRASAPGSASGAAASSDTSRSGGGAGAGRHTAGATANGKGAATGAKKVGCLAGVRGLLRRKPADPAAKAAGGGGPRRPESSAGSQSAKPPPPAKGAGASGGPQRAPLLVRVREWFRKRWAHMPWNRKAKKPSGSAASTTGGVKPPAGAAGAAAAGAPPPVHVRVREWIRVHWARLPWKRSRIVATRSDVEDGTGTGAKDVGSASGGDKPPDPPGAPAAKGHAYTTMGKILTRLGLRSYFVMGQVVEIPYSVRAKWFLIFGLICCGIIANPFLAAKAGFGWTKPASLCKDGDLKLLALRARMINITKVVEGRNQLASTQNDYNRLNNLTRLYNNWPNGCDSAAAQAAIDEAKGRTCSRKECKWGFSLFDINCVEVSYGCPGANALGASNAWKDYLAAQAVKSGREPPTLETVSDAAVNRFNNIITTLLWQIDIAGNLYIAYLIVSVLAAPPFYPYKPSWEYRILGSLFRLSKPMWILLVLIVWIGGSYIYEFLNSPAWNLWWHNFAVDPCYNNPVFVAGRLSSGVDVCNDVFAVRKNYTDEIYATNDTFITARGYFSCFSEAGMSPNGQWPAKWLNPASLTDVATAVIDYGRIYNRVFFMNQSNVTGTFVASCNISALNSATSRAPSTSNSPNVVGQLFKTGFIAQIFFKFILVQVLWSSVAFYDPLVMHGGKVEIYYFKQKAATAEEIDAMMDDSPAIPRKAKLKRPPGFIKPVKPEKKKKTWQDRLRDFARDQWIMVLILSWALFLYVVINMIVSAASGSFKDNTDSISRLKAQLSQNITTLYVNRTSSANSSTSSG